jgi:flagellar hook protein FlgE
MTSAALGFTNGSDPSQTFTLDYANNAPTQFSSPFTVNTLQQDGFPIGRLTGVDISEFGVVRANYSNGQQTALGKIAMARFANNQGLQQKGGTLWSETLDSGVALAGEAGTSSFGSIRGGALEQSNVDLTAELVHLITAQRNFQANAKSIETENAITQTVIQIR